MNWRMLKTFSMLFTHIYLDVLCPIPPHLYKQVKKFGKPTWRRLVEAVEDPAGGNNYALALQIAAEHPGMQPSTNTY